MYEISKKLLSVYGKVRSEIKISYAVQAIVREVVHSLHQNDVRTGMRHSIFQELKLSYRRF